MFAVALAAAAPSLDAPIEQYRKAQAVGELGTLSGRAIQERRRPSGPDQPLIGTAVVLLPRSDAWLARLEAIKHGARDSADAYRQAATKVRRAREAYERALLEAGAGDFAYVTAADHEGRFRLAEVPAGAWVMLASRAAHVNTGPPGHQRQRPGNPFPAPERLTGYDVVTYWLLEVNVVAGAVEEIQLTDRNAWFNGVMEDYKPPPPRDQPFKRR